MINILSLGLRNCRVRSMKNQRQELLAAHWKTMENGTSSQHLIAPSLLSADFANLQAEIETVSREGGDWLHIDVMDGHFVPNLTLGAPVVSSLSQVAKLPLDVHLMIMSPERFVEDFARAGTDILTIHLEATSQVKETLQRIRSLGMRSGLSLRPKTSVYDLLSFIDQVDLFLVMTVEPGFGGQAFMQDQISKINFLRKETDAYFTRTGRRILIEVDGGINDRTSGYCENADVLVAGSYVFGNSSYQEAIQNLKFKKDR